MHFLLRIVLFSAIFVNTSNAQDRNISNSIIKKSSTKFNVAGLNFTSPTGIITARSLTATSSTSGSRTDSTTGTDNTSSTSTDHTPPIGTDHTPPTGIDNIPTGPDNNTPSTGTPQNDVNGILTSDMEKIMEKVDHIDCGEDVRLKFFKMYTNNQQLFDNCIRDSNYQIFPVAGRNPNAEEIIRMCNSKPCTNLFSGVILAKFQECDIESFSIRTASELMFRIKKDLDEGRPTPTPTQFEELYNLNRVANLLRENTTLVASIFQESDTKFSVTDIIKVTNEVQINPNIRLGEDYKIIVDGEDRSASITADEVNLPVSSSVDGDDTIEILAPHANSSNAIATSRGHKSSTVTTSWTIVLTIIPTFALSTRIQ